MLLDREGVLRAFRALDEELGHDRIRADVFVVGGAAMAGLMVVTRIGGTRYEDAKCL